MCGSGECCAKLTFAATLLHFWSRRRVLRTKYGRQHEICAIQRSGCFRPSKRWVVELGKQRNATSCGKPFAQNSRWRTAKLALATTISAKCPRRRVLRNSDGMPGSKRAENVGANERLCSRPHPLREISGSAPMMLRGVSRHQRGAPIAPWAFPLTKRRVALPPFGDAGARERGCPKRGDGDAAFVSGRQRNRGFCSAPWGLHCEFMQAGGE